MNSGLRVNNGGLNSTRPEQWAVVKIVGNGQQEAVVKILGSGQNSWQWTKQNQAASIVETAL